MRRADFDQHPVWTNLEGLQEALNDADRRDEAGAAEQLDSIRYLVSLIKSHADASDTAPYAAASLQAVSSNLPNIINEVTNYASNGNLTHLGNAEQYADQTLHALGSWPSFLLRGGAAVQATKVFEEYRKDATEAISALRERNSKLKADLATQEQTIDTLSARIKQDETRLDAALTNNNEAFTAAQSERQKQFDAWLEEQGESLDSKAMPELSEVTNIRRRAQERLEKIEKLHADVEKVSGKAAGAILAKDYGTYSTREWVSGIAAYVLGFGALVGLAVYLLITVSDVAKNETVSWQYVALKLGLTVSALAASGVAFQFGSRALSRASTNKRVQLELGTIGTFLADVGDDEAVQQAKLAFVGRMFGRAWDENPAPIAEDDNVNVSALSKIFELVGRSNA